MGTVSGTPSDDAQIRPFKLRLSRPGKNIGGEWLGRLTGAALAYQSYCGTNGSPRVFTWYHHRDGNSYLKDQEGNWLSYESIWGCLYMSYWSNAVAWRIDGGQLIRVSDGAVLTWHEDQRWRLADEKYMLQALPPSDEALTVEVVESELSTAEKLLNRMVAVYAKRHPREGPSDPDRYLFTTVNIDAIDVPERQRYVGNQVAFFGLSTTADEVATLPVNVLRMQSEQEQRTYYKLSLQAEEAGYSADPAEGGHQNFYAFPSDMDLPFLVQIYEHSAPNPTSGQKRYTYDTLAAAHDGWGPGTAIFRAIPMAEAQKALSGSLGSQNALAYAQDWVSKNGDKLIKLVAGLGKTKDDVSRSVIEQQSDVFDGLPPLKYMSVGGGFHFGYGFGTAGAEFGSIWDFNDFGYVPKRDQLADYAVEWITFGGATGVDVGGSADWIALGCWFGEMSQIEGACNGITISGQYVAGAAVNLLWDGSWHGANYTPHPIGLTISASVGYEFGAGVFYNSSATQFYHRSPKFPQY